MKIILLSGKPNTGKSTTLNLLFNELTQNGTKNIVSDKKELGNPAQKDFECVVSYKGKEIAIFCMGDYYSVFIDVLIKYANCDVLVLAYNETFAKKLDKLIEDCDYHCVIRKTVSKSNAEYKAKNEFDCERIIEELKRK